MMLARIACRACSRRFRERSGVRLPESTTPTSSRGLLMSLPYPLEPRPANEPAVAESRLCDLRTGAIPPGNGRLSSALYCPRSKPGPDHDIVADRGRRGSDF